jgi:hypothetical protein
MPKKIITMDSKTRKHLEKVIDYLWYDEEKNWADSGKPSDHIFVHLRAVKEWLDELEQ